MENVYVLLAYVAALIALVGCGLLKVGDILEQKRDEKYYAAIKDDADFWQMRIEHTLKNTAEFVLDEGLDRIFNKTMEMTKKLTEDLTKDHPDDGWEEECVKHLDELEKGCKEQEQKIKEDFEDLDE